MLKTKYLDDDNHAQNMRGNCFRIEQATAHDIMQLTHCGLMVAGAAALPHCMLRVGAGALIATTSPLGFVQVNANRVIVNECYRQQK